MARIDAAAVVTSMTDKHTLDAAAIVHSVRDAMNKNLVIAISPTITIWIDVGGPFDASVFLLNGVGSEPLPHRDGSNRDCVTLSSTRLARFPIPQLFVLTLRKRLSASSTPLIDHLFSRIDPYGSVSTEAGLTSAAHSSSGAHATTRYATISDGAS